MKKSTFDRCRRAVSTMTSAQRHDLKVAIEWRDKKDLVAAVVSLVGTPHHMSPLPPPRDSAVGKRFFLLHARRRDSGSLPTGQIVVDKTCSPPYIRHHDAMVHTVPSHFTRVREMIPRKRSATLRMLLAIDWLRPSVQLRLLVYRQSRNASQSRTPSPGYRGTLRCCHHILPDR